MLKYLKLILTLNLLFLISNSQAQLLEKGVYVGYEVEPIFGQITHWTDIITSVQNVDTTQRFHFEVKIYVFDSSIEIHKRHIPTKNRFDSTEYIFIYNAIISNRDGKITLFGSIKKCVNCEISADPTPKFVYVFYTVHVENKKVFIDSDYEKRIVFKKYKLPKT